MLLAVQLVLGDRLGPLMERTSGCPSSDCPSSKHGVGITKLVPDKYPELSLEFKFLSGGRFPHGDVGTGQGEAKKSLDVTPF